MLVRFTAYCTAELASQNVQNKCEAKSLAQARRSVA
jgi:hypothetical protein